MKFTIITPCFNASSYIEETVLSVLGQAALAKRRVELQYIIVDGGSTDGTLQKIEKFRERKEIKIISEKDHGMYDAIAKGLRLAEGEFSAYLNAGDIYQPSAFDVACDIFTDCKVDWFVANHVYYNERSEIIDVKKPFRFLKIFIENGQYGRLLPAIQQESIFWRTSLTSTLDLEALSTFRLAGDCYMWSRFSSRAKLFTVNSCVSGFKLHDGQLSSAKEMYQTELSERIPATAFNNIIAIFELFLWIFPRSFSGALTLNTEIVFDRIKNKWVIQASIKQVAQKIKNYLGRF